MQSVTAFSALLSFWGLDICTLSRQWYSRSIFSVGLRSREFAGQPSFKFGYKVWRILLTPCLVLHPWFFALNNFLSSGHLLPDALMLTVNRNPVYAAKRLNKWSLQLFSQGFGWCGTQTLGCGQGVACVTLRAHDPSCHPTHRPSHFASLAKLKEHYSVHSWIRVLYCCWPHIFFSLLLFTQQGISFT